MPVTQVGTATSGPVVTASVLTNAALLPTGSQVGDVLVAVGSVERGDVLPTFPASWTVLRSEARSTTNSATIAWKRAVAADITAGSVTATVSAGRRMRAGCVAYRGAADPVHVSGAGVGNGSGVSTLTGPTASPTVNDSVLVSIMGIATNSAPLQGRNYTVFSGGHTELVDAWSDSTSSNAGVHIAHRFLTGQAGVSQAAIVLTDVAGASSSYIPSVLVIAPSSTTTPPTAVGDLSYDVATVDLSASTPAVPGAVLTFSVTPTTQLIQEWAPGKFLFLRSTADVEYTFTVSEAGGLSTTLIRTVGAKGTAVGVIGTSEKVTLLASVWV